MDTRRTIPILTSQFTEPKDVCILVVQNDPIYRNIILRLLEFCNHYEVMKFKTTSDAIKIIQEKKDLLNSVLTDVHHSHSNGPEILSHIRRDNKLTVLSMDPHQNATRLGSDAKLIFVKSLSLKDFFFIWDHAYIQEKGKQPSFCNVSRVQGKEYGTSLGNEYQLRKVNHYDQNNNKRKFEETGEPSEKDNDESQREKIQSLIWNEQMHLKFLQAVQSLGNDRAYPNKILEIMNVPGLARNDVARHLQEYRESLRFAQVERHTSTNLTNFGQQNFFEINNQENLIFPYIPNNSPFTVTRQTQSSLLANVNTQPGSSINNSYVGLRVGSNVEFVEYGQRSAQNINSNTTETANFMNGMNGNESLAPFPWTEFGNDHEQQFYLPPAQYDIDDIWNEIEGTASSDVMFDFDGSLSRHI